MGESTTIINTGLRGVTVASTRISDVDGKKGRLIYRGFLVADLAERASFEEVVYLLLYEHLPDRKELAQFKDRLASERWISDSLVAALKTQPAEALPMDIVQAGVSFLANEDQDIKEQSKAASERMAVRLIAKFPVLPSGLGPDPTGTGTDCASRRSGPRGQFPVHADWRTAGGRHGPLYGCGTCSAC